ncbi:MAG: hypothetical protein V1922_00450 [bacterium]
MTILKLFSADQPCFVKESYQTIKRRIYTSELFFEVTIDGHKVNLNKTDVEEFSEAPKRTEVSDKEVKVVKKLKKLSAEKAE